MAEAFRATGRNRRAADAVPVDYPAFRKQWWTTARRRRYYNLPTATGSVLHALDKFATRPPAPRTRSPIRDRPRCSTRSSHHRSHERSTSSFGRPSRGAGRPHGIPLVYLHTLRTSKRSAAGTRVRHARPQHRRLVPSADRMLRFVLARLSQSAITLLLSRLDLRLARATGDRSPWSCRLVATEEDFANAPPYLGLDRPLYAQYVTLSGGRPRGTSARRSAPAGRSSSSCESGSRTRSPSPRSRWP